MISRTTFWELITHYKICIPVIQRDYAHGRVHEAEKRNKFLDNIHAHLTNNKNLHFNFIYGQMEGNSFTPIDGQQRLTTLFLLHWYVSLKEDIHIDDRKVLDKFMYEGRISSRDFCHALIHQEIEIPTRLHKEAFADTIKNKFWYKRAWNNDPSIQSMLVMIDAMHQKFNNVKKVSLWQRLTQDEFISFDLLDMGKNGHLLPDELYIKMNARGKQLTPFESFKARFIQFVDTQYKNEKITYSGEREVSYANYFAYKIEKEWTNLFWLFREDRNTLDENLSDYFRFITRLLYLQKNTETATNKFKNTFAQYKEVYSNEKNLLSLFESLDTLYDLAITQGRVDKESLNQFVNGLSRKVERKLVEVGE